MRSRKEIEEESNRSMIAGDLSLVLEVLLDIRDMLMKWDKDWYKNIGESWVKEQIKRGAKQI